MDPIALGIPHYHAIIPQHTCRDLGTIKRDLERGHYSTPDQVVADLRLMIANALKFNPPPSLLNPSIQAFGDEIEHQVERLSANSLMILGKRPGSSTPGGPPKKARR